MEVKKGMVIKVKRVKKPVFFIVFLLTAAFCASVFFGISSYYGDIEKVYIKGVDDIRFGIDIKGGVDVTFTPPEGFDATDEQLDSAREVIVQRMINLSITDYEAYVDYNNDRIIVRFPWKEGEADFDPEAAVKELGETAQLTFREQHEVDELGKPAGVTLTNIILEGKDVAEAFPAYDQTATSESEKWTVALRLTEEGTEKFAAATAKLYETGGTISIWMDDTCISYPRVSAVITNGSASISGSFDSDSAKKLADQINSGALPFKLVTASFSTISPSLGAGALEAMVIAGIIAFAIIAIYMIVIYKLPGVAAVIALAGQVGGTLAFVSGYFGFRDSSILTIPGIAGIILAVGMGVDANVITAERIKEELNAGKTLNGALQSGYKRALTAILDGNITMILIAIILMGAFGTPDSIFAKALHFAFFMFGPSTAGTIYSFGFTLLTGTILNLFFGVLCSRLMLMSLSGFKAFRNPKLYGGGAANE
ncbi:MAG: preprotein translocase subunit SecD [Huintestinicola sp.]